MSSSSSSSEHGVEEKGIRLFGVVLRTSSMRKSASLGNLVHCHANGAGSFTTQEHMDQADGYLSDGLVHSSSSARARRKGVPWTEDEHRAFLVGLQKLGKGDWRGISRSYVKTRTPTQVASHAQKYFIRQSNLSKRKRRSSLFDISPEVDSKLSEISSRKEAPPLHLGFKQEPVPLGAILEEKPYYAPEAEKEPAKVEAAAAALSLGLGSSHISPKKSSSKPAGASVCEDSRLSLGLAVEQQQPSSRLSLKLEQPTRHYGYPSFGNRFTSAIHCT